MQASTEWKNRENAKASGSVVVLETLIGKGEQVVEHGAELASSMSKHTLPNPDAALKSDMRKAFAAACEMRNAAANDGEAITTGILALGDALVANQHTNEPMNSRIRTRSRSRSRSHNVNDDEDTDEPTTGFDAYFSEDVFEKGLTHASPHNQELQVLNFEFTHPFIKPWLLTTTQAALKDIQRKQPDKSLRSLAITYSSVSLDRITLSNNKGWRFHEFFGFMRE